MTPISRSEAKELGLKTYFNGKPCPNGHIAPRNVGNSCCTKCVYDARRKYREKPENRERERLATLNYIRQRRLDPEWRKMMNERKRLQARTEEGRKAIRNYVLRRQMNTSIENVEATLEAQNHKCPICERDLRNQKWGKKVCDHDHQTGQFRAVLCSKCNAGLGYFNDDPALFESAIKYLVRFHAMLRKAAA